MSPQEYESFHFAILDTVTENLNTILDALNQGEDKLILKEIIFQETKGIDKFQYRPIAIHGKIVKTEYKDSNDETYRIDLTSEIYHINKNKFFSYENTLKEIYYIQLTNQIKEKLDIEEVFIDDKKEVDFYLFFTNI